MALAHRSQRGFVPVIAVSLYSAWFSSGCHWLVVVSVVLIRLMLSRFIQGFFRPIDDGLSLAALVRFETIGDGPSFAEPFRIGRCRPFIGSVGMINCFPDSW